MSTLLAVAPDTLLAIAAELAFITLWGRLARFTDLEDE